MTTYANVETFSGEAGTAITLYRFVVRASDGQYDHTASTGGDADGVAAEAEATVGAAFPIAAMKTGSIMKVEAGAAVTENGTVMSDTTGRVIDHVSAVGDFRLGKALEAAAGAGEIIRIQLHKELDEVT